MITGKLHAKFQDVAHKISVQMLYTLEFAKCLIINTLPPEKHHKTLIISILSRIQHIVNSLEIMNWLIFHILFCKLYTNTNKLWKPPKILIAE